MDWTIMDWTIMDWTIMRLFDIDALATAYITIIIAKIGDSGFF
jgi:hypothetical protein